MHNSQITHATQHHFYNNLLFLGYAALAIAEGLRTTLNIDIVQVRTGAVPFLLSENLMAQLVNFPSGALDQHINTLALMGSSYSSTNRNLANYDMGQNLLSSQFTNASNPELNVIDWINGENILGEIINERLVDIASSQDIDEGDILSKLWDATFVSFLQQAFEDGVEEPCSPSYSGYQVGVHDKLCEALVDNSLMDLIMNVKYPVHICHSQNDELMTYATIPDDIDDSEFVTITTESDDHMLAGGFCFSSDVLYLKSWQFRNHIPEKRHGDTCFKPNYDNQYDEKCVDAPFRFDIVFDDDGEQKTKTRSCDWVKNKSTKTRCKMDGVKEMCPATCGACQVCADSTSKIKVMYNGEKVGKDCDWVRRKNTPRRCKVGGIRDVCRKTCGNC